MESVGRELSILHKVSLPRERLPALRTPQAGVHTRQGHRINGRRRNSNALQSEPIVRCAHVCRLHAHNTQSRRIGRMLIPNVMVQVLLPLERALTALDGTLDQIGAWAELPHAGGLTPLIIARVRTRLRRKRTPRIPTLLQQIINRGPTGRCSRLP